LIKWHSYLRGSLKPIPKTLLSAHGCSTAQLNMLHKSKWGTSLLFCYWPELAFVWRYYNSRS